MILDSETACCRQDDGSVRVRLRRSLPVEDDKIEGLLRRRLGLSWARTTAWSEGQPGLAVRLISIWCRA